MVPDYSVFFTLLLGNPWLPSISMTDCSICRTSLVLFWHFCFQLLQNFLYGIYLSVDIVVGIWQRWLFCQENWRRLYLRLLKRQQETKHISKQASWLLVDPGKSNICHSRANSPFIYTVHISFYNCLTQILSLSDAIKSGTSKYAG